MEDERLRREDDRLRAQVQRLMTWTLVSLAVVWGIANAWTHRSVSGGVVASWLWTMAALGLTLRQAIVLWTEEEPSGMNGEIELAGAEA